MFHRVSLFVFADLTVAQDAVIQDGEAACKLVADHAGKFWLGDHVKLQANVPDAIAVGAIALSKDHAAIVVKRELVF